MEEKELKEYIKRIMDAGINQIFICKECNKEIQYHQGVLKHFKENPKHYIYKLKGTDTNLCFA